MAPSFPYLLDSLAVVYSLPAIRQELKGKSYLTFSMETATKGRKLTYTDIIFRDTEINQEELKGAMADKAIWKKVVSSISATAAR